MKSHVARRTEWLLALLTAFAVAAALVLVFAPAASADQEPDRNKEGFWEDQFEHPADCFKHDKGDQTVHGSITDGGYTVTLNVFNQSWPGDHWEALIVKAGSSGGDGYGNMIYHHPTAGVAYPAPDGKLVSHWIVCKGTTPPQTTTTTTVPETTTTTVPETTTTTVPETTTTVPETTTTTEGAEVSPTSIVASTEETLPFTGAESGPAAALAMVLMAGGALALVGARSVRADTDE
jgi:hypothetical protein